MRTRYVLLTIAAAVAAAGLLLSGIGGLEVLSAPLILGGVFVAAHLWVTIPQRIPLS